MQTRIRTVNVWRITAVLIAAALLVWARTWLWQAAAQLFWGMLLALAALPVMKKLETRMQPASAAAFALGTAVLVVFALLALLAPPLIAQGREVAAMLPRLYEPLEKMIEQAEAWLVRSGIVIDGNMRRTMLERGQELLASAIPAAAGWLGSMAGNVGKWLLVPAFAYYFLRDRAAISRWLLLLIPLGYRRSAVRILREMKRETAGYLRGQMMACTVVGGLTAAGLLCCGVPAWLFLGFLMGMLEFIPYAGPVLGGGMAVLFALPGGLTRTLWALGVVVAVQQLEGMVLSPKFMSEATRLHPLAVLICVMIGGAAAGFSGVLLAVPLVLCIRAAVSVLSLRRFDQ